MELHTLVFNDHATNWRAAIDYILGGITAAAVACCINHFDDDTDWHFAVLYGALQSLPDADL